MDMKEKFKEKMNDRSYEEKLRRSYIERREKSEERANSYSIFLSVICALVAIAFFVFGEFWLGLMFIGIGAVLILMVYLSRKEEEKEDKNKKE